MITQGVVTAIYPTGGFNGFYLQTAGTGGAVDATPGASDGVFVFGSAALAAANPAVGDLVEVTAPVAEFAGQTELTPAQRRHRPARCPRPGDPAVDGVPHDRGRP